MTIRLGRGTLHDVTDREPIPIGESLDSVMRSLRGPGRQAVSGVFGRWAEVVGPQVADHVTPCKLDGGVLLVEVDDPAWATQLAFMTDTIRERLDSVVGVAIDRIDVRVRGRRR